MMHWFWLNLVDCFPGRVVYPRAATRFNRQRNIDVDLEAYGGLISASRPVQAEGLGNKISINQSTV